MKATKEYNTTDLRPDIAFERHVFHRDLESHYYRWSHLIKEADIGEKILDVGCGNGNLLMCMYANRYKPASYLGVDIRKKTLDAAKERFKTCPIKHEFKAMDIVLEPLPAGDYTMISCFEVLEHVQKKNVKKVLENIKSVMTSKTRLFISTPCYDAKVGAAGNHTINGEPQELTYAEMKKLMNEVFSIKGHWGTFCSKKDILPLMNENTRALYDKLHMYYDSNVLSVMFAPLFPEASRNVIWEATL